jgi:hypothetical protein
LGNFIVLFGNALAGNEVWRLISILALGVDPGARQKNHDGKMEAYIFPSYVSVFGASLGRNFVV